jgi:putative nucleotidyltransferase with HDIG domain
MEAHPQIEWVNLILYISECIDRRISKSGKHSVQVAELTKNTAQRMSLNERETQTIYWAALLHDIGKVGVPEFVLMKNGPLNKREWSVMRLHPTIGANIVSSLKEIAYLAPIIHAHQEKFDGSGYPFGLRGEKIPLGARILAVVDAYDAMTDERVYRKARSHEAAVEELRNLRGKQFDPEIVQAFIQTIGEN